MVVCASGAQDTVLTALAPARLEQTIFFEQRREPKPHEQSSKHGQRKWAEDEAQLHMKISLLILGTAAAQQGAQDFHT
eukprot:4506692-Amphidinium_carterae.1